MSKYYIYKHTCIINNKSYIGQTQQKPTKRWKANGRGYEYQEVFYKAIQKYGWDNFTHEILEEVNTLEEANEKEKYWISYYHTYVKDPQCQGYNLTLGGDGSDSAKCEYVREKLRLKAKKKKVICIETQEIFNSVNEACQINKHVANCLNKSRHTASGYHWAYLDDLARQEELKEFIGKDPVSLKEQGLSKRSKAVICIDTGEIFQTVQKAIDKYGVSVRATLDGKTKTAYGYHWRYLESEVN